MKSAFVIRHPSQRAKAIAILKQLDPEKPFAFSVKPYRRNRSQEQNALMWIWYKEIADSIGYASTGDLHEEMKEKYLIPILMREDEDFQIQVEAVRELRRRGQGEMADFWKSKMLKEASTTDLNTKLFSEYTKCIEVFAAEMSIPLTQPDSHKY